jgi:hypothetical protein
VCGCKVVEYLWVIEDRGVLTRPEYSLQV